MDQQKQSRAPAGTGDAAQPSINPAGKRVDLQHTPSPRLALASSLSSAALGATGTALADALRAALLRRAERLNMAKPGANHE
jgi:hypothetical protein